MGLPNEKEDLNVPYHLHGVVGPGPAVSSIVGAVS